jgi:hypothetical protein
MASTWRSYQSLTAWLVAQISGPAKTTPLNRRCHRAWIDTPDETTPHMNAHMGANHVIGLKSSRTARGAGIVNLVAIAAR